MPSLRYTRIEISQEAYMVLEAEAIIQGKTLKKLASELILNGVSEKALRFIHEDVPQGRAFFNHTAPLSGPSRRGKLASNASAVEMIKTMWSQNPRPSQQDIAKEIDYPASSVRYYIQKMLDKGELQL